MQEELNLVDGVTRANLSHLANDMGERVELAVLELKDIADRVISTVRPLYLEGLGAYDLLSYVSDGLSISFDTEASANAMFADLVCNHTAVNGALYLGVLSNLIARGLSDMGLGEEDFLPRYTGKNSFTYVKNIFADEAFDVFSADFDNATVRYSRDFAECVKLAYTGEVSYALLPFEERGGTRLPTVLELIYRNDLKINAVTPVFGPDGTQDLKYCAVSRAFSVPELTAGDDRYLEIRISSSQGLSSLTSVIELLGHSIYRVNTHSFSSEEVGGSFFSVVIRDEGRSFLSLLTYLTLFITDYMPVGIYKNLE